mmetsp:Transcript_5078/g.10509  ORF Transcript_5078/g.10509 Transcript_5078/m.10509 type:complete len:419 (-) Transcript_5078:390-1646(-)
MRIRLSVLQNSQHFVDVVHFERLGDEIKSTGRQSLFSEFNKGMGRHEDNLGSVFLVLIPFHNDLAGLKTVHDGHLHVHQYAIKLGVFRGIDSLFPIVDNRNVCDTHAFEDSIQNFLVDEVVFSHQNLDVSWGKLSRFPRLLFRWSRSFLCGSTTAGRFGFTFSMRACFCDCLGNGPIRRILLVEIFQDCEEVMNILHFQWFRNVPKGSGCISLFTNIRNVVGSDKGNPSSLLVSIDNDLAGLEATHDGHFHVHENAIESVGYRNIHGFLSVVDNRDIGDSKAFQNSVEHLLIDNVVVYDKHLQGKRGVFGSKFLFVSSGAFHRCCRLTRSLGQLHSCRFVGHLRWIVWELLPNATSEGFRFFEAAETAVDTARSRGHGFALGGSVLRHALQERRREYSCQSLEVTLSNWTTLNHSAPL